MNVKINRRLAKQRAKKTLKRHYMLFVAVCLATAFLGAEFASSLDIFTEKKGSEFAGGGFSSGVAYVGEQIGDSVAAEIAGDIFGESEVGETDGISRTFGYITDNNIAEGESEVEKSVKQSQQEADDNKIMQRKKGVLAKLINDISSGTIVLTVYKTVESVSGSPSFSRSFLIVAAALAAGAFWFFVENTAKVISRRIFLEGRIYEKIPLEKFVFLLRTKKQFKASFTMLLLSVFQTLWNATIIGGIIKKYSYYLVPYIVAENPDIGAFEAINLSKKMMRGHKWECFVWEISFIPLTAVSFFTFGLLNIFYTNPYKLCTFSEFYTELREKAKAENLPLSEQLNDRFLFEIADEKTLGNAYVDIIEIIQKPDPEIEISNKFARFMSEWFGVVLMYSKAENEYETAKAEKIKIANLKDCAAGKMYPERLGNLPRREKSPTADTLFYARNYSVPSLVMQFFCFSFIGWLWEVSLHLIEDGVFVNRGMLHGPWLPIYGSGGVLVFVLLKRLREKPLWEFCGTVVLCGTVEYFSSLIMEIAHDGQRWWNYSGYFINLNGRICAEGLLVFGLAGMGGVYFLAPFFDNMFRKINQKVLVAICMAVVIIFAADLVYSTKTPNTGKGISMQKSVVKVLIIENNQTCLSEQTEKCR